jgi:hypothetical protein
LIIMISFSAKALKMHNKKVKYQKMWRDMIQTDGRKWL